MAIRFPQKLARRRKYFSASLSRAMACLIAREARSMRTARRATSALVSKRALARWSPRGASRLRCERARGRSTPAAPSEKARSIDRDRRAVAQPRRWLLAALLEAQQTPPRGRARAQI